MSCTTCFHADSNHGLGPRSRRRTSSCERLTAGASLDQNATKRLLQRYLPVSGQFPTPMFGVRQTREHTLSSDRSSPARQSPKALLAFPRFSGLPESRRRAVTFHRGESFPVVSEQGSPSSTIHPCGWDECVTGEETRVKDCRTSRRFPSSIFLLDARVTDPS